MSKRCNDDTVEGAKGRRAGLLLCSQTAAARSAVRAGELWLGLP